MSMLFRTIGSLSRTLAQAMAPAAIFILALIIYTGFVVNIRDMHPCKCADFERPSISLTISRVPLDQLFGPSRIRLRGFND